MNTPVVKAMDAHADASAIEQAAELLRQGQIVAFPTETVYGLGADASSLEAVNGVFVAKNRPADNPLIVHIAGPDQVATYCSEIPAVLEPLARAFWPGPLTLVVKAQGAILDTVCRGLDTVALRVPNHPIALALIRAADRGLAAPSANLSGRPSPTRADHVLADMDGRIPMILDGGPCQVGLESTVLDITGETPVILRPGDITRPAIEAVLGQEVASAVSEEAKRRSPGTRYRHYSPNAEVWLVDRNVSQTALSQLIQFLAENSKTVYIGSREISGLACRRESPESLAASLYAHLRDLDQAGYQRIVVETGGLSDSLQDRLAKAASHEIASDRDVQIKITGTPR